MLDCWSVKMMFILVLCPVWLAAGVQTLTIDSQLGTSIEDCFERISIGEQLPPEAIYRNVTELTLRECEQICKQDKQCQSYDYGVGAKGNATCNLGKPSEKEVKDEKILLRHPDYDVYVRRFQCEQSPPSPIQPQFDDPLSDTPNDRPVHRPVFRPVDEKQPFTDDYLISTDLAAYGVERPVYKPQYNDRPDDYSNPKPDYDAGPSYGSHKPQDVPYPAQKPVKKPPYSSRPDPYDVLQLQDPYNEKPGYPINDYQKPHKRPYIPETPEYVYITRLTKPKPQSDTGYGFPSRPFEDSGYGSPTGPYPSDAYDRPRPTTSNQYASGYGQNVPYDDNQVHVVIRDPPRPYDRPRPSDQGIYGHGSYSSQNSYSQSQNSHSQSYGTQYGYNDNQYTPAKPNRPGYGSSLSDAGYSKPSYSEKPSYSNQGSYGSSQSDYTSSLSSYGSSQSGYTSSQSGYGSSNNYGSSSHKPNEYNRPSYGDYSKPNSDYTQNGYGNSQVSYGSTQGSYGSSQSIYGNNQSLYGNWIKPPYNKDPPSYGTKPSYDTAQSSYGGGSSNDEGYSKPTYGNDSPSYGNNKPSYGNDRPGYGNDKPSYNDDRPSQGNEKPGYGNDVPSYGGTKPSYDNDVSGYGSNKPSYGNDAPSYGGSKPSYGTKPSYGNDSPPYGNEKPSYDDRPYGSKPAFGNDVPSYGGNNPSYSDPGYTGSKPGYNDDKPSYGGNKPYNDRPSYGVSKPSYDHPNTGSYNQGSYYGSQSYGSSSSSHSSHHSSSSQSTYGQNDFGYGSNQGYGQNDHNRPAYGGKPSQDQGYGNRPSQDVPSYGGNQQSYGGSRPSLDQPSYGNQPSQDVSYGGSKPSYSGSSSDSPSYGNNRPSQDISYGSSQPSYGGTSSDSPSYGSNRPSQDLPSYGANRPAEPTYQKPQKPNPTYGENDDSDSGSFRKPWSKKKIASVKFYLKNGCKTPSRSYYWQSKYELLTSGNEEFLIHKRKRTDEPIIRIVPSEEFFDVLNNAHKDLGHRGGIKWLKNKIKGRCDIPKSVIQRFVSLCPICNIGKKYITTKITTPRNLTKDFDIRGRIDLIDLQSSPDGEYNWVLSYQDNTTKFLNLRPLKTNLANEVASELLKIFLIFGAPYILESIHGREFAAEVIKELVAMWPDCKIVHGCSNNLKSQSIHNQDVQNFILSWMVKNESVQWSIGCYFCQYQNNTLFHEENGHSPFKSMFGTDPKAGLSSSRIHTHLLSNIRTEEQLNKLVNEDIFDVLNENMSTESNSNTKNTSVEKPNISQDRLKTYKKVVKPLKANRSDTEDGLGIPCTILKTESIEDELMTPYKHPKSSDNVVSVTESHLNTIGTPSCAIINTRTIKEEPTTSYEHPNSAENYDVSIMASHLNAKVTPDIMNTATIKEEPTTPFKDCIYFESDESISSDESYLKEQVIPAIGSVKEETATSYESPKINEDIHGNNTSTASSDVVECKVAENNRSYGNKEKSLKRAAETVVEETATKVPSLEIRTVPSLDIGSNVLINLTPALRKILHSKHIKGKIVDIKNGMYLVGTRKGRIKKWYSRHKLRPIAESYDGEISSTYITLQEAVLGELHNDFVPSTGNTTCSCKPGPKQCRNAKCSCYKRKEFCGIQCHIDHNNCFNK